MRDAQRTAEPLNNLLWSICCSSMIKPKAYCFCCFVVGAAVVAGAPAQCGTSTSFCPTAAQCCKQQYSPSTFGCLPSTDTQPSDGCGDAVAVNPCCKMGPAAPMSTTLPNCIILGDSVSIGYFPAVAAALKDECLVQHAPWDVSDGGAGSTAAGLACLDNYLVTQAQEAYTPDAVLFNFGLHDLSNGTRCETEYARQLANITARLAAAAGMPPLPVPAGAHSKIGFVLTTPFMPLRLLNNTVVEDMNALQVAACVRNNIPTVDLYAAVAAHCGPVPYADCDICRAHPCSYHYNSDGEQLQAKAVVAAFRAILASTSNSDRKA